MQKFEIIELNNKDITIDTSLLVREQLYFNATEIAKQFNKDLSNFMRSKEFNQYIDLLILDSSVTLNSRNELIKTKQGGKYQGTWLHHKLALKFAVWLSVEFEYELFKFIEAKLNEEKQRKDQRELAKELHPKLTKSIKNAHKEPKPYHFSNELDMINKIITGYKAKEFKELHNIECVRDGLCMFDIELLNNCQIRNQIMIDDEIDYEERKKALIKYVNKQKHLN
jgi:hypothetical protein